MSASLGTELSQWRLTRDVAADKWVKVDDTWVHRPLFKVVVNAVLRALQPGRSSKWVVFSKCVEPGCIEPDWGPRPRCIGYGFGPVEHKGVE